MASKDCKLPGFLNVPKLDYCTGRILSLANELASMGYKHRTIAHAALRAGLNQAHVNGTDFRPYLRLLEETGHDGLADLDRMAEAEAAEAIIGTV